MGQREILDLLKQFNGTQKLDARAILKIIEEDINIQSLMRNLRKLSEGCFINCEEVKTETNNVKKVYWVDGEEKKVLK